MAKAATEQRPSTSAPRLLNTEAVMVAIGSIAEHPRNPNRGDMERIAESIAADGFYGAIVVQKSTGLILAGNHRYRAAVEAGMAEVPVCYVDIDDEAALRILVKDNRIAEFGERDEALLAELLADIEASSGLRGTGFTEEEVRQLAHDLVVEPPEDFAELDESIPTEHECPKCHYRWSGGQ